MMAGAASERASKQRLMDGVPFFFFFLMRDGPGAVRSTRASEDRIPHFVLFASPLVGSRTVVVVRASEPLAHGTARRPPTEARGHQA
jgi:hypothetical protein